MRYLSKALALVTILVLLGNPLFGILPAVEVAHAFSQKTTISVLDSSPWFTKGTNSGTSVWYSHTFGSHDYISTYVGGVISDPNSPDGWAKFKPYLSTPGRYDVYASFFGRSYYSTMVPFTICHSGGSTAKTVNQWSSTDTWKEEKLGTWDFPAGETSYVMVTDATGESYDGVKALSVGAVRFVKVNQPPTCSLSVDKNSGKAPLPVTFTMSASDTDGSISAWVLDVNGDGNKDYWGTGDPPSTQTHTYTTPSPPSGYSIVLMVSDNDGATGFGTETVVVGENAPPECSLEADKTSGKAPLFVTFTMNASDVDGSIISWALNPGDGNPAYSGSGNPPATQTHTYTTAGSYTAILAVSDNDDAVDFGIVMINVDSPNQAPDQPHNTSPSSGATSVSLTPTLESSPFSDPDAGDTHSASQWQITATSGNYSSPVFGSGTGTTNLTSISIPSGVLNYSATYYWHVRHQDNRGDWSEWSAETSFATWTAALVYASDFSSDPGWVTSNPAQFYWDGAGQRYRYQLVGGSSDYVYVPVAYGGGSFRLSFDLQPTRTDFAASHVFGISNPNLNTGEIAGKPKIFVRYAWDVGGVHFWLVCFDDAGTSFPSTEGFFANSVTYHNVINYEPGQLSLLVTRIDTGEVIKSYSKSLVGTFTGMDRLYASVEGIGGGNTGAVAEGYIDNVELCTLADTTPPVISNVASVGTTITWNTDELSTSQVAYSTASHASDTFVVIADLLATYGAGSLEDSTPALDHTMALTGLTPYTTYYYRVISKDASNNPAWSAESSFTFVSTTLELSDLCVRPADIALQVTDEETMDISATVHNDGNTSAYDVLARFFYEDTVTGEVHQIGSDQTVSQIAPRSTASSSVVWNTPEVKQHYNMIVSVDPYNSIAESDEINNVAVKRLAGRGPVVVSVTAQYDGDPRADVIGTFVSSVELHNTMSATVSHPDGNDRVRQVVFRLGDQVAYGTISGDVWSASFDMGSLSSGSTVLQVIAYDDSGLVSPVKAVTVKAIGLPDWLKLSATYSESIGQWTWSSRFLVDEMALKFTLEFDPSSEWSFDVEDCAFFSGHHTVQFPRISGYVKFYLDSRIEVGGTAGFETELFGAALNAEGGVSGELTRALELVQLQAFIAVSLAFDIPTRWSLPIPGFTTQGIIIRVEPHGQVTAYFHSPDGTLVFQSIEGEIGVTVGAVIQLGDESLKVVPAYAEGYVLGDGSIAVIYDPEGNPSLYLDSATLRVWGGIKVRWLGTGQAELEIGPYEWTLYEAGALDVAIEGAQPAQVWMLSPYLGSTVPAMYSVLEPGQVITDHDYPESYPSIASDGNGNAVLVWVRATGDDVSASTDLYYSMWDGNGWSTPQPVAVNNSLELNSSVAYVDGAPMVVWVADNGDLDTADLETWLSGLEIYFSIWDGEEWSEPQQITDNAFADGLPALASNGSKAMAVWVGDHDNDLTTSNDLDIRYSYWDGSSWSSPAAITSDPAASSDPSVAYYGDTAVVTWVRDADGDSASTGDREICYAVWDGSSWSAPQLLTSNSVEDRNPHVAFNHDGNAAVVWVQSDNAGGAWQEAVYFAMFSDGAWGDAEIVSGLRGSLGSPSLSFTPDNHAVVTWIDRGAGNGDVFYSVRDAGEQVWSPPCNLTADEMVDWQLSMTAVDGDAMLVWLKHSSVLVEEDGQYSVHSDNDAPYYLLLPIAPDLAVTDSDIGFSNWTPAEGETVSIEATIHNWGGLASGATVVRFFDGDPATGSTQIGTDQALEVLAPGASATVSVTWTATGGVHDMHVIVDPDDTIAEGSKTNNTAYNTTRVLPDLTLDANDIGLSSTTPTAGENINISASIHNAGGQSASDVVVRFFDGSPDAGGTQIGPDQPIAEIAPGAHQVASVKWTVSPGPHDLCVQVILDSEELDDTNNLACRSIEVLPDLAITTDDISFSTQAPVADETIIIQAIIRNTGGDTAGNTTVRVFDGNPLLGGGLIAEEVIGPIAAGGQALVQTLWSASEGQRYIHVVIDPEDDIAEYSKDNNTASKFIVIRSGLPDVAIGPSDIVFSDDIVIVGGDVTINATVSNIGTADAASILVEFFDGNPDDGGSLIGAYTVALIGQGQSHTITLGLLTGGVTDWDWVDEPRLHHIYVRVGLADGVLEVDTDNNTASVSILVNSRPDQPLNVSPDDRAEGVSLTPTLESSAFSDPDAGDSHAASQWQVTTIAGDYSSPVFNGGTDTANLTNITLPAGALDYGATYYWQVRHQDSNGVWSEWSSETCFTTVTNEVVNFPDVNLEAAIRAVIGKPAGDIYQSDLGGLTGLDASYRGIADLTGLEHCTSLTVLYLHRNQISDISPLAALTNLTQLWLDCNQINDLQPLARLTDLEQLAIGLNEIGDISPILSLTNLELLYLGFNPVSNIGLVSNFSNLKWLDLRGTGISDIGFLAGLTELISLSLSDNEVCTINPISRLTNLEALTLGNNQIADITPLSTLSRLAVLWIENNQISNIAPLCNLTNLGAYPHWGTALNLSGN